MRPAIRRLVGRHSAIMKSRHISRCLYGESCSPISTCAFFGRRASVPRPAPCQRLLGQRLRPADEHPASPPDARVPQQHGECAPPRDGERLSSAQPFARPDCGPHARIASHSTLRSIFCWADSPWATASAHLPTFTGDPPGPAPGAANAVTGTAATQIPLFIDPRFLAADQPVGNWRIRARGWRSRP